MKTVTICVEQPADQLCARIPGIMAERIRERCPAEVQIIQDTAAITLGVDPALPAEGYRIAANGAGVRITAGTPRGLLYGAGRFLRESSYDAGGFTPSAWRGESTPRGLIRGMYYASHFHNWYASASEAEIVRYTEDLALWGINAVMAIFPGIDLEGWDDPEAERALEMLRRYARTVHGLGLQFATAVGNTWFQETPMELLAAPLPDPTGRRGNSGYPVCPSEPAGHTYILGNARRLYAGLAAEGVDLLVFWPYDEGGCPCERCAPWGANGYPRMARDLTLAAREYFTNVKTVLSTWMFDVPPEGEWAGLSALLAAGNDWCDYILADSHEDFPRYPLEHPVPGGLPLLNFPEISMWALYPWGGFGANPLPRRFQRLWNQARSVVRGGFPYSEGIYEDINKAVEAQFYWDADSSAVDTLRAYAAYEFGPQAVEDTLRLVALIETAHTHAALQDASRHTAWLRLRGAPPEQLSEWEHVQQLIMSDLGDSAGDAQAGQRAGEQARDLAVALNARLPAWAAANWRWRILYLRAQLEPLRRVEGGLETAEARAAMRELVALFHCTPTEAEADDLHKRVRPPLKD
ncbi:MAG: hypothetical protein ACYC6L_14205 [Anaerolineae bacterium]